jgi:pectate lyase
MAWSNWITTKANKTLVGMGRGANLRGASIYMRSNEGAKNQIYRNLGIYDVNPHLVEGGDGLSIVGGSTNRTGKYWADHISYKWISDGLDIEYSTETTVSWLDYDGRNEYNCYLLDPFVALVEDADVTYANNYWHATTGRVPKVGSGTNASRVHLYNNYTDTNTYYMIGADAVSASAPTQVRFENNYVNHASHAYVFQGANGNVWWSGNTVANSTAKFYDENNAVLASAPLETVFTPSYGYTKRTVANLPTENPLHAGVGGRWGKMPA